MFTAIAASTSTATVSFPVLLLNVFRLMISRCLSWPHLLLDLWKNDSNDSKLSLLVCDHFSVSCSSSLLLTVVLSASNVTVRLAFRIRYKCLTLIQTAPVSPACPVSPCESHCNTVKLAFFFPFTVQSN